MRLSKSTKPSLSRGRHASVMGENHMDSTAQNSNDINRAISPLPIDPEDKRLAVKQVSQSSKFYKLSTVQKSFKSEEQKVFDLLHKKRLEVGDERDVALLRKLLETDSTPAGWMCNRHYQLMEKFWSYCKELYAAFACAKSQSKMLGS